MDGLCSFPHSGPVLATRLRRLGSWDAQLWVEDCAEASAARLHAVIESAGWRCSRDIPDSVLTYLFEGYQESQSIGEGENALEEFLYWLLGEVELLPGAPSSAPQGSAMAAAKLRREARPSPGREVRSGREAGCPHTAVLMQSSSPELWMLGHSEAPADFQFQLLSPESLKGKTASLHGSAGPLPPKMPKPEQSLTGPRSRRPASATARRAEERQKVLRSRLPEEARPPAKPSERCCQSPSLPGSPQRRTRPSSAKELKHRRVIDDCADSMIYEDVVEEQVNARSAGTDGMARPRSSGSPSLRQGSWKGSFAAKVETPRRQPDVYGTVDGRAPASLGIPEALSEKPLEDSVVVAPPAPMPIAPPKAQGGVPLRGKCELGYGPRESSPPRRPCRAVGRSEVL